MALLGFILGFLVALYLSFAAVAIPFAAGLGGGLKGAEAVFYIIFVCLVLLVWYLLFKYAPFTLSVTI